MWLINVKTRALEEFFGSKIPRYAILSHTWEEEEVSYKRYVSGDYVRLKGFGKIDMTCRFAEGHNIGYAWVDTCCIDKSSSAELSEAINSMFRWYQRAEVCYVYLSDLLPGVPWSSGLERCRWFTRGWTLQELIAPTNVMFFDSSWGWNHAGWEQGRSGHTKTGLAAELWRVTKIDQQLIEGRRPLHSYSAAQKLSWASRRQTTRTEDMAYCLLGIFDLNMPLLYGEEDKAFQRLQEEIMRSSADLSIFAWSATPQDTASFVEPMLSGMFARSPADFENCGLYERCTSSEMRELSTSNIGIKIRTRLSNIRSGERILYTLPLNCCLYGNRVTIHLRQIEPLRFLRRDPELTDVDLPSALFVGQRQPLLDLHFLTRLPPPFSNERFAPMNSIMENTHRNTLRITLSPDMHCSSAWPPGSFDVKDQSFFVAENAGQDFTTIHINWFVNYTRDRLAADTLVRGTIIALDWAASSPTHAKFSICNDPVQEQALQVIQQNYNLPTGSLVDQFPSSGIRQSHHLVASLPGSTLVAVLMIEPKLERQVLVGGSYSEVVVRGSVLDQKDVPEIGDMRWEMGRQGYSVFNSNSW